MNLDHSDFEYNEQHMDFFRQLKTSDGFNCPCCTRWAKMYSMPVHRNMCRKLFACAKLNYTRGIEYATMFQIFEADPCPTLSMGNFTYLRFWGLVITKPAALLKADEKVDGWRVTQLGLDFINGRTEIPKHALIFGNRCFGFSDKKTSFKEAAKHDFNLAELLTNQQPIGEKSCKQESI